MIPPLGAAMRVLIFIVGFLVFGLGGAGAQSVALHQAAAPAAAAPAKATGATIIPGSPLAALTGGAAPASSAADADMGSPFGSGNIGLSVTSVIGTDTAHTLAAFDKAVRRSTALTPVSAWAAAVFSTPARRGDAVNIVLGLLLTVVPAWVVEALLFYGLARPRRAVAARAARPLGFFRAPPAPVAAVADEPAHPYQVWGRRFVRAVLYAALALLPLAGFVVSIGMLLGFGVIGTRQARLAVVVVSNAYLFCRLLLEVLRFVLAPMAPGLRLVAMSDKWASWIVLWVRIVLVTGAAGYAAISICEILGLAHDGTAVLTRLVALVVHIEVARMIWEGRGVVARWIAGRPDAAGEFAKFRRRFARIWHYFALFYVLALWIALAGGVQNAFGVLLRVVLVFFIAMLLGRLAWVGSTLALDKLFPEAKARESRHSTFYTRARVYNPAAAALIRVAICFGVAVTILQGWGFEVLPWLLHDKISRALISALIAIVITLGIALTLWEVSNGLLNSRIESLAGRGRTRQSARLRTLLPMLRATIGVVIFLVAGLICLSKIGVNAAPLLAGASVLGIAIGFGSQKLVQDVITGLFLLLEDAIQVGDVVSLGGLTGTVERLSIRTIRLRGGDGSVNIIPFSAVTTVTNMTRDFGYAQISIQVGYEEDLTRVSAVLKDIAAGMRAEAKWAAMIRDDLQIFGLDQFGASALVITGQIRTGPGQHWAVRREFYARVKARFEADRIDMPYTYLPPAPTRVIEQAEATGAPPPNPAEPENIQIP